MLLLIVYVFPTNPLPFPRDDRKSAQIFVKQLYPDTVVSPADRHSAYVAIVFALIRSGNDADARRAIDFAAGQRFGNASPYVIERLESGDTGLRQAARAFLVDIAGKDYGPSADAWRAWWRNPPRMVLGIVPVGQLTLELATPVLMGIMGLLLWAFRRLWKGTPRLSWALAWIVSLLTLFMAVSVVAYRLFGAREVCTFGSESLSYYSSHGVVLGLEDARIGDSWLFVLFTAGLILLIGILGVGALLKRRRRSTSRP
jgi:hypothetical protein